MLKDTLQIGQEKFFLISKIKSTVPRTYIINDLNGKKFVGKFYEKNCRKQLKKNLEYKK